MATDRHELIGKFKEALQEQEKPSREVDYKTLGEFLYGDVLGIENYKSLVKGGYPVLLGIDTEDKPIIVDLDEETSGVLVGDSGVGKSWVLYSILTGLVITNTPEELKLTIVDIKHTPILNEFEKLPHVTGYTARVDDVVSVVRKTKEELDRRKKLLNDEQEESVRSLRNRFKSDNELYRLNEVAMHVLVIDDFTPTVEMVKNMYGENSEEYREFKSVLEEIALVGRSYGVKLLVVGQQVWESKLPKIILQNSTLKMSLGNSYTEVKDVLLFGTLDIPNDKSEKRAGVMKSARKKELVNFKGLPLATNGKETLRVVKQVAEKWSERVSE